MRVANEEAELINSIDMTQAEARVAFGDDTVYMEKFLQNPRHVEVQIISDGQGNTVHLGDRDCSLQRRHQKVKRTQKQQRFRSPLPCQTHARHTRRGCQMLW